MSKKEIVPLNVHVPALKKELQEIIDKYALPLVLEDAKSDGSFVQWCPWCGFQYGKLDWDTEKLGLCDNSECYNHDFEVKHTCRVCHKSFYIDGE